ncbi:MAG: CDP-diacylglycerol--glycerol-3-phosphate 3-phosphatidyltransferase [Treponema sp.]|jgi:CDP-diacylglycerol--glycerol-3-phosphate 3-phosphatidyltransferase|nr:CDP-diacylglycerol--glycerol-3-phosphate 3-phosphatidyltransferase [Treponema sp.]
MNLANKLTLLRVILAPLFFTVYFLPMRLMGGAVWTVALLWLIFIAAEFTDMFDGMAARRLNQGSDFGKLFDPFADTIMQITCFLCFSIDKIIPAALFVVVFYREFGILFIRNLMLRKGVVMGARRGGKMKTITYITAASIALLYSSLRRLAIAESLQPVVKITVIAVFGISVLFSVLSFFDYVSVYRASYRASSGKVE